jgi:hypothetical protein
MRLTITIDEAGVLDNMWYSKSPAKGITITAMQDEDRKYIEIVIGRDHPLFNFTLIYDTCDTYRQNMFKGRAATWQFFEDLENIIFELI